MRQVRWASWMVGMGLALAVCGPRPAAADVRSDQAAAIVNWPSVVFFDADSTLTSGFVLDTVIQLSNTSVNPVFVHCFYENANTHCNNSFDVCEQASDCCVDNFCGICEPGWNETDFHIQLTPRQPLGWLASEGVAGFDTIPPLTFGQFPLDGASRFGTDGTSSNAGSRIPPVPEEPFNGALRCIAVDQDNVPVDSNVLKGEATITLFGEDKGPDSADVISVAKHNAIGIQAIHGAVNNDNILTLGPKQEGEYNGCPSFLILDQFFDGAIDPIDDDNSIIVTALTLVPCTADYLRQLPGKTVVQYLVYNEFEQRFSTSQTTTCKQLSLISNIDTTQNIRSIFSAGVSGTLTGQTRINPLTEGLLGVATEIHIPRGGGPIVPLADVNLHYQGDRDTADFITLPPF